ncbi:MAG: F0F1 ATP synthase subunit A [Phycisphaerae bacterium]|nr:F0F1 ATP synthase subunit A [Phycisphaerae bacterium]
MVWMLAKVSPLDEVTTKALFQHPFVFTNHMLMITLGTILLLIVMPLALRRKGMVLSGFGNAIEAICLYLREEVVRPFLHDKTDKYIGYLWTMFYFILTLNLLGMIPLNRIVWMVTGGKENHLGGAATANIYVTGTLAMVAFFLFHVAGIVENGLVHYIKTFCPKVPWPMMPFMFFMEVVSSFVRMFSLAIRLFANILAGHVLLGTLILLITIYQNAFVATASTLFVVAMSLMELFVAFLQAYIFTFLTTIFIGLAVNPDH